MKKKILILILLLLICVGCKDEKKEEDNMQEELTIINKTEDGEITEGVLESYKFKETDTPTNRVKIQMENGHIMLAVLSNSDSPITIANFKKLVSQHFYDGLIFHRVIEGFMIQGGDPTGTGAGGSEEQIKGEFAKNGVQNSLSHTRGVLSMGRRGGNPDTAATMDSASSQFFIVHKDYPSLDGNYASFGKVYAGLSVLDEIATTETDVNDRPIQEQRIKTIRFITNE